VRNGDAAAYARRSQVFPLEQVGRDLIGGQAETGRRPGRQFLHQQPLLQGSDVDHDVARR
jgi:hypothetical protein